MEKQVMGYWTTKDLCARYRCSRRSIYRWIKRECYPFPKPCFQAVNCHNLWAMDDVYHWEAQVNRHPAEAAEQSS